MKRNYIIIGVILVLLIGIIGWRVSASAQSKKNGIQTAPVTRQTFVRSISSSGKTAADKAAELRFQVSGRLQWVGVKEGDSVQAWQAIAGLDTREVQKNLKKALFDYSAQRNTFDETTEVTYKGIKTEAAPNDTIKRILQKNQWDLDKAVTDVELDHLAVEYATLVSPIAGIVAHLDTPVAGVNITPAGATFEIVDPDSLIFQANVDEVDVGNLSVGQSATIMLDAFPEATFSGHISYVSFTSETSAGGATVFPVKIAFDAPQNLRIGLNGDVSIDVKRLDEALTLPVEAIREDDTGKYVYKKTKTGYDKVMVRTGDQNDADIVITSSGLTQGDRVVIKGFDALPKPK